MNGAMNGAMTGHAVVIGGGPAGLMAAEMLARCGATVTLCEAKPSVGRKFLMAGKSGLNLTKADPRDSLLPAYAEAGAWLAPMISAFDAEAIQDWAEGLGQTLFTGSTGRVFPTAMKASPLLRAWLARLTGDGVTLHTRWRWTGWAGERLTFDTPQGAQELAADITILALGGASWARLGSDGGWSRILAAEGIDLAPFAPANAALSVDWSAHMQPHLGAPLKNVRWSAGTFTSRGEAVISARGLEGGGIYAVSRAIREGAPLTVDLMPDRDTTALRQQLSRAGRKASLANRLRKVPGFDPAKRALLQEFARPLPAAPEALAARIKALEIRHAGLRPMDEAISTAGGLPRSALTDDLMLNARPGTFCAGEMLDWEAPTGGYLLTACLATGRWAGQAALRYMQAKPHEIS